MTPTRLLRATRSFEDIAVGSVFGDDGKSERINALVESGYLVEMPLPEQAPDTGAVASPAKGKKVATDGAEPS